MFEYKVKLIMLYIICPISFFINFHEFTFIPMRKFSYTLTLGWNQWPELCRQSKKIYLFTPIFFKYILVFALINLEWEYHMCCVCLCDIPLNYRNAHRKLFPRVSCISADLNKQGFCFVLFCCFRDTPNDTQGLLLILHSRITPA